MIVTICVTNGHRQFFLRLPFAFQRFEINLKLDISLTLSNFDVKYRFFMLMMAGSGTQATFSNPTGNVDAFWNSQRIYKDDLPNSNHCGSSDWNERRNSCSQLSVGCTFYESNIGTSSTSTNANPSCDWNSWQYRQLSTARQEEEIRYIRA